MGQVTNSNCVASVAFLGIQHWIFVTIPRGFIFLLFNWFHQKLIRVSTLQNKEFIIQKMDLETPDSYAAPTILWFYSWFICGKYSCAFNWDYQRSSWSKFTFRQVLLPLKIRLQDHPHCGVVCRPHRTVRQWIALLNTNPTIRKSWFTSKMFEKILLSTIQNFKSPINVIFWHWWVIWNFELLISP